MKQILLSVLLLGSLIFVAGCGGKGGNGGDGDSTNTEVPGEKKQYIRYNAFSPKGQEMVASMKVALEKMRNELPCTDVTSWYYMGGIHWPPGPSAGLSVPNPNTLCPSFDGTNNKEGWGACTHASGNAAYHLHFVTWHCLYIWHMEKIIRKYSGNPDFALPYWPYNEGSENPEYITVMGPFRDPNSSLYTAMRRPSLNAGSPFDTAFVNHYLDTVALFKNVTYQGFTQALENAPHNKVHNYCGGFGDGKTYGPNDPPQGIDPLTGENGDTTYGWMTNLTSAFDPIFWPHHAQIDRLWLTWTGKDVDRRVTLEQLNTWPNKTYLFSNPDGTLQNYTYQEVIDKVYNMDYIYDTQLQASQVADVDMRFFDGSKAQKQDTVGKLLKAVALKAGDNKITIPNLERAKLDLLAAQNPKGIGLALNVTVSYAHKPKGGYQVYLNRPAGTIRNVRSEAFVGHISFFGPDHAKMGHNHGGRAEEMFFFELHLSAAATAATEKANYELTFVADGIDPQADVKIEQITIVKY